jgi:predicted ATP-dependent endonuclease of OLD family
MPTVEKARVQNYKSITDTGFVELDRNITTIVGENAAGKSNFLEALTLFKESRCLTEEELCSFESAEYPDNISDIPIVSIQYKNLSLDYAPYINGITGTHDFLSTSLSNVDCPNELIQKGSNTLNSNFIFKRYANGRHTIVYSNDRTSDEMGEEYNISDLAANQLTYLQELSEAVIDVLLDIYDFPASDDEFEAVEDYVDEISDIAQYIESEGLEDEEDDLGLEFDSIKQDLRELGQTISELNEIQGNVIESLPPVFSNRKITPIEGKVDRVEFSDLPRPYQAIIKSTDVLNVASGSYGELDTSTIDLDEYEEEIEAVENELEGLFNGYWQLSDEFKADEVPRSPGNYEFRISYTNDELRTYIKDETGTEVTVGQESSGIRWLIAFFCNVILDIGGEIVDSGLIVIDDPGIHLHPEAQKKLYKEFEAFSQSSQVVFCTHSPFLISNRHDERIRLMKRNNDETVLTKDLEAHSEDQADTLRPVRAAIGAYIGESLFGAEKNLLVEGQSDKQYINTINSYFKYKEDRTSISNQTNIITISGSQETYLAKLLDPEFQDFLILKDDDATPSDDDVVEGKYHFLGESLNYEKRRKAVANKLGQDPEELTEGQIDTYVQSLDDLPISDYEYDIEQLLEEELFYEVLDGKLGEPKETWRNMISDDEPRGRELKGAIQSLSDGISDQELEATKTGIAEHYCELLEDSLAAGSEEQFEKMLDRFHSIITDINEKLA